MIKNEQFVGNFGWRVDNGKLNDGYLYELDDFDKELVKDISLKEGERIFRYINYTTAIGGISPMIKINLDKELLYFSIQQDDDSEDIVFQTKGIKPLWINLVEKKMWDYIKYKNNKDYDDMIAKENRSRNISVKDIDSMEFRRMDTGGNTELDEMFEKAEKQSISVRFKIASIIGIDKASEYLQKQYVVNPFKLIELAVRKEFITIDEINERLWDAAVSEAEYIEEDYKDSGHGIGSSDMNAFISEMLNDAGLEVKNVFGIYQRMVNGGKVDLEPFKIIYVERLKGTGEPYRIYLDNEEVNASATKAKAVNWILTVGKPNV